MNNRNNRNDRIEQAIKRSAMVANWLKLSQESANNIEKGYSLQKAIELIVSIEIMIHDEISDNLQEILMNQPALTDGET